VWQNHFFHISFGQCRLSLLFIQNVLVPCVAIPCILCSLSHDNPEDGGSMDIWNVGILPQHYSVSTQKTLTWNITTVKASKTCNMPWLSIKSNTKVTLLINWICHNLSLKKQILQFHRIHGKLWFFPTFMTEALSSLNTGYLHHNHRSQVFLRISIVTCT